MPNLDYYIPKLRLLNKMEKSMDWQDNCFCLNSRAKHLFNNEKLTDCIFSVGLGSNQKMISAHRLILAMGSPVFERKFYGSVPFQDEPIIIPDIDADIFHAMIKFIYTDQIYFESMKEACEIWVAADKYMVRHLVEIALRYIWYNLSYENATVIFGYAQLFEQEPLIEKCVKCICSNMTKFLEHPSFFQIEPELLIKIFQEKKMNINSEQVLLNALQKYSENYNLFTETSANNLDELSETPSETQTNGLDNLSVPNENDRQIINQINTDKMKRKKKIKDALKEIRFLTLSVDEFLAGTFNFKILTDSEKITILSKISSQKCEIPEGFNEYISKREAPEECLTLASKKVFFYVLTKPNGQNTKVSDQKKARIAFEVNEAIWMLGVDVSEHLGGFNYIVIKKKNELKIIIKVLKDNKSNFYYFDKPVLLQPFEMYTIYMDTSCVLQLCCNNCNGSGILCSNCRHTFVQRKQIISESLFHYKPELNDPTIKFTVTKNSKNLISKFVFCYPFACKS